MWLKNFKTAIILKEFTTIDVLIEQMPQLDSLAHMEEAAYLLHHAKELLEAEQITTLHALQQLKNTLDFLKATENSLPPTINIKL